MIAQRQPFDDDLPPTVKLPAHRMNHPVRTRPAKFDDKSLACFEMLRNPQQATIQPIPESLRDRVRGGQSLPRFYRLWLRPIRLQQVAEGRITASTLTKERQAIRRFAAFDRQPPEKWPHDRRWTGLPIGYVSGAYLDRFLAWMLERVAHGTVESTWCHLRTVLNLAVQLGALDEAPRPKPIGSADDDEDLFADVYSLEELGRVYTALAEWPALQAAWVLGANVGPRTVDLFGLRWETNVRIEADRPSVLYRALKTGKRHWVPLAGCVLAHLWRLTERRKGGLLFREFSGANCKDPERSRAARRRNAIIKGALERAGVEPYEKPWQVLRSTCNSRLNNHRPGVGRLILHGLDYDVNSQHYFNPTDRIVEAIGSLPQPPEFTGG